jgi:hypothetical protein
MNTPDKPPAEKGYIFCRAGEVLNRDTEFWSVWEKKWVPISKQSIGYVLDDDSVGHFRRAAK